MNEEPLQRVGLQDITAHVDLSAIARAALREGLSLLGATVQSRLLYRLGIGELAEVVDERVSGRVEQRAHRAALSLLVDEDGLGRITATVFGKNAPEVVPMAFQRAEPLDPVDIPDLWTLRLDALGLNRSVARQ